MATVKPFKAFRPTPERASEVAELPYDVMSSDEAREMVKGKPYNFLHVDKAEIDLDPAMDIYDERVYQKASENLQALINQKVLVQDQNKNYYIYRQTMNGRTQTGIVGCPAIDDYLSGNIKKHEFTRADKEADRIRHVDTLDANTGPIFLTYRPDAALDALIADWAQQHAAVYDFVSDDGIGHTVWVVDNRDTVAAIERMFGGIECLYIADGHHRCASAAKVGELRRQQNPNYSGEEEFNFFLAVMFPSDQLKILDYNRVVNDLNGQTAEQLLERIAQDFSIAKQPAGSEPYRPQCKHEFGMYLGGAWYSLTAKPEIIDESDPVARLDVSVLQDKLLAPVLGIEDPRVDKRIDFVGGIRGLAELERRVNDGMRVAFSMFATTLDDLMAIADAGLVMPPKSTWFEPKLRSGLFVHKLH